eukprot:TRINITY_DN1570_c2_g2_i1.p1 TRINITY_DN1570_c2_g2~~TRINITY_DN1570_c2_g2_i1.p1  ORF type:complete len:460 (+),score=48.88 TRINITY_DN1570_c2_g2_i1:128-1381(+)
MAVSGTTVAFFSLTVVSCLIFLGILLLAGCVGVSFIFFQVRGKHNRRRKRTCRIAPVRVGIAADGSDASNATGVSHGSIGNSLQLVPAVPQPSQPPQPPPQPRQPPLLTLAQRAPPHLLVHPPPCAAPWMSWCGNETPFGLAPGSVIDIKAESPVRRFSFSWAGMTPQHQGPFQISSPLTAPRSPPQIEVVVELQDLRRGYASQLACLFGGTFTFHDANVATIIHAYGLDADDICYCFLCLEQVSSMNEGSDLALKRHGLGPYAARIWTVSLARFVYAVQGLNNAADEEHLNEPCESWGYKLADFTSEIISCEAIFRRKYGNLLLMAFQQEGLRQAEVARARRALCIHGSATAEQAIGDVAEARSANTKRCKGAGGGVAEARGAKTKRRAVVDDGAIAATSTDRLPRKRQRSTRVPR